MRTKKKSPLKIPYAVGNFEEIRNNGYYFVDKTEYLRELEKYKVPVFLRPRRFGKTLLCSILQCYYDVNRKDKFKLLFNTLSIGKNPTGEQNSYMVLRFNFSKVQVDMNLEILSENFSDICFYALRTFIGEYNNFFNEKIVLDKRKTAGTLLENIIEYAIENNLPPIYLIIDEYDNFSNQFITAKREDLYETVTTGDSFFRTFFKVIKAGVESQAIGRIFITGVLPITIDDLTSGFNIAEIVTLKKQLHNMIGFTQPEVNKYLKQVFEENNLDVKELPEIRQVVKNYYNGYRFLPNAQDSLYNSTIFTYFLKNYVIDGGEFPVDMIDPNVKTDVNWIRRLSSSETEPLKLLEKLLNGEGLPFDSATLSDKFNMRKFFNKDFYPVSLFYLGMLSIENEFEMNFPNQTLSQIFADYYNILADITVSKGYTEYFKQFLQDTDIIKVFAGYFKTYISQIPAQAFDKINENFYRITFFELCTRYLSRNFSFAIEANYPSGRSDWEMLGRHEGIFCNQKVIIEFKYFKKTETRQFEAIEKTAQKDAEQVVAYARDTLVNFPHYTIRKYVCYIHANVNFKMFEIE